MIVFNNRDRKKLRLPQITESVAWGWYSSLMEEMLLTDEGMKIASDRMALMGNEPQTSFNVVFHYRKSGTMFGNTSE
ncbi:hypothetical protein AVEN_189620-1, partial [Araneus ventricosus]